ncbi:MAG: SDR family NAD(P)-dependent oxidoreductase [Ilumatobacter sp.]
MTSFDGQVAIITGAGRGIGREHARYFAEQGARVVVNDHGGDHDGSGSASDGDPAEEVASEIRAVGGEAIANTDDVTDWAGAERMIATAIEAYGDLDILVNNAGILRDRTIVNMTEAEWDDVVNVHLKGHFVPTHHAAVHWRNAHKAGTSKRRFLVHTSSTSGLFANPGQANYGAAKSGVVTFSQIASKELARYDVTSNCIAPAARTRLTLASPGLEDIMATNSQGFDEWDPANVSPLVAYLSSERCEFSGETFFIQGGIVKRVDTYAFGDSVQQQERWTVDALADALAPQAPARSDPAG